MNIFFRVISALLGDLCDYLPLCGAVCIYVLFFWEYGVCSFT